MVFLDHRRDAREGASLCLSQNVTQWEAALISEKEIPQNMIEQVGERLGARLNAPLPAAHRALLKDNAAQAPEDMALVERMSIVQKQTLKP